MCVNISSSVCCEIISFQREIYLVNIWSLVGKLFHGGIFESLGAGPMCPCSVNSVAWPFSGIDFWTDRPRLVLALWQWPLLLLCGQVESRLQTPDPAVVPNKRVGLDAYIHQSLVNRTWYLITYVYVPIEDIWYMLQGLTIYTLSFSFLLGHIIFLKSLYKSVPLSISLIPYILNRDIYKCNQSCIETLWEI